MAKFRFVTITHPDAIKDKREQSAIRKHAIRSSVRKARDDSARRRENFVIMDMNSHGRCKMKRGAEMGEMTMLKAPSAARLDPFDSLPGSPERLRVLMGHKAAKQAGEPVFCVEDTGKIFFQGMDTVSRGALTDPALFHALSLVLALAANKDVSNLECLTHRGETLRNLGERMSDLAMVPQVSTLTAMLLLIGYEYRVDGAESHSIAVHIRAVDEVIKMNRKANVILGDAIRRALFWQDLYSCLFVGTSRLLSHEDYPEFCWTRDAGRQSLCVVPVGIRSLSSTFPSDFGAVLENLNALCVLVDSRCSPDGLPINELPIDNNQAWIESRLVNLLSESRRSKIEDPMYEACIFAAFLCTYKLSTGIWEGCFIPEFCASQILGLVSRATRASRWKHAPELLLWLLFVSGALARRSQTRLRSSIMILRAHRDGVELLHEDWEKLKRSLKMFIWSEHSMEREIRRFWADLNLR